MNRFPSAAIAIIASSFEVASLAAGAPPRTEPDPPPQVVAPTVPVELLGPRELTISPKDASAPKATFKIPFRSLTDAGTADLTLRTVSVTLGGRALDPSAVQFKPGPAADLPEFVVEVDLDQVATAGSYSVKVLASTAGPGRPTPVLLDYTITRPAAELQVFAPIRIERLLTFPFLNERITPSTLTLSEASGKSAVTPSISTSTSDLHRSREPGMAGQLAVDLPRSIAAGGQGQATIRLREIPLGQSTGEIVVRAPELSSGSFKAQVEVFSRLSPVWLVPALVLGVTTGYIVRTSLERRKRRLLADVTAGERLAVLDELLAGTPDPTLQGRIKQVAANLRQKLAGASTPEQIEASALAAGTEVDAVLKEADARRAAIRAKIAALRADLRSPEGQPTQVRRVVEEALRTLGLASVNLDAGLCDSVGDSVESLVMSLPNDIQKAVMGWGQSVEVALRGLHVWPGTLLPDAKAAIETGIAALTKPGNDPYSALLPSSAFLAVQVQTMLIGGAMEDIGRLADDAVKALKSLKHPADGPELGRLEQAIPEFRTACRSATVDTLSGLVQATQELHEALSAALRAATPAGNPPKGLADGDFTKAIQDVIDQSQTRSRGLGEDDHGDTRAPEVPTRGGVLPSPAAPDISTWSATISGPQDPRVDRPITLSVQISTSEGRAVPSLMVRWFVDGSLQKEGRRDDLYFTFTPRREGTVQVLAEVESDGEKPRSTAFSILVRGPVGIEPLPKARKLLMWIEGFQTIVAAALIVGIGFGIFKGPFVGSYEDFLSAVVWGFTTDVGVSKIQDIAKPMLNRTPAPAPPR